jgi:hypothetical protein
MNAFRSFALLLAICALAAAADGPIFADTAVLKADSSELARMKMAELRHHLRRLGVDECSDCVEKEHFRQRLTAELAAGTPVTRSAEEAQEAAAAAKKPSTPPAAAPKVEPTTLSEADMAGLREMMRKKKGEDDKMKEALRKAGLDPNSIRTDSDMFADILNGGKAKNSGANGRKKKAKDAPSSTPAEEGDL